MAPECRCGADRKPGRRNRAVSSRLVCSLSLSLLAAGSWAQSYPAKPVRIVVPFSPGGSTDVTARILAQKLTDAWRQQVIVDNRAGAGGNIGAEAVAKSPPDGYTLLLATTGVMAINHKLYRTLPYDALKDFAPVTQIGALPLILIVHPSLPARSVKQLVAIAKAKPGQLSYASSGVGSATHMTSELFRLMAGIDMVHIPYKGSGQAMADLISGQVGVAFDQITSSLPQVQTGKLRALAVTSAKRFASVPDLPSVAEAGIAGYESVSWNGIAAPAATPRDVIQRIQEQVARALQTSDMKERFLRDGIEPIGSTPEQFGAHIRSERAKWESVVERAAIKPL
ncbi:MAG: tripartite tricarboxylate transporter substrate binding protein [Burkholderiales bacterium]|nr:tripartite tricarboxylate transporter substrate binding protein [Burkholderiales bacterium]